MTERRYLAAVLFEDAATGALVRRSLRLATTAPPHVSFFRTVAGLYVAYAADGFEEYAGAVDAPPPVAPQDFVVEVRDDSGLYLPRTFVLSLPRALPDEQPAPPPEDLVTTPVRVALYRSLRAPVGLNWATIAARLVTTAGPPLRNALVRVINADDTQRTTALMVGEEATDRTLGEIVIPVVGIPVALWSTTSGPPLATDIDVTLEVVPVPDTPSVFNPDEYATAVGTTFPPSGAYSIASGSRFNAGNLEIT